MTDTASMVFLVIMAALVGSLLGLIIGHWLAYNKGYKEGYNTANWVLTPMIGRVAAYAGLKELADKCHGDYIEPDFLDWMDGRDLMEARGIHV